MCKYGASSEGNWEFSEVTHGNMRSRPDALCLAIIGQLLEAFLSLPRACASFVTHRHTWPEQAIPASWTSMVATSRWQQSASSGLCLAIASWRSRSYCPLAEEWFVAA
jgi:hypothetical protein